jgi:integrase
VKPATYLLADVIRDYLAEAKSYKRSYRDDARYGKVWGERFAGRTLDEITAGEIEKIKSERLESVAAATVNREVGFLRHVFNVAIRDGKTERNPAARVRTLKEPSGRVRYLSDEEEAALLAAFPDDADGQRLLMLVHTGLRKSEFLHLRWRDVDLRAGVLTIPRSKNGAARHVPLNSIVRGILSRLPRPLDGSALVFPNGVGGPDLRWAEKTFPAAVSAAEIEDFRLHDCRHTFASRLAMAGVDLRTLQDLGGWRSLGMVARYAHLSPGHRHTAIERLVTRDREGTSIPAAANGVAP